MNKLYFADPLSKRFCEICKCKLRNVGYEGDLFEFEIAVPSLEEQHNILSMINALHYILLLGLPLEQSVTTPEKMLKIQEQNRRLRSIRDAVVDHMRMLARSKL